MPTIDDVVKLVGSLPEVSEGERYGHRTWQVNGKTFAWIRPFSKADVKRFGEQTPPGEPILALGCADLHEKEALLAAGHPGFFTIPHFNNYAAVLVELDAAKEKNVRDAIVDAWLACASPVLAEGYLNRDA